MIDSASETLLNSGSIVIAVFVFMTAILLAIIWLLFNQNKKAFDILTEMQADSIASTKDLETAFKLLAAEIKR
jgi:hypothetical protein